MFTEVLNKYNPKYKQTHGILRFFAEDLSEIEQLKLNELIFKKGSWTLPTEISSMSESSKLKDYTKSEFHIILKEWVSKRIEHNSYLSLFAKNPFIPNKIIQEFKEIIFSIRNLGFPIDIMTVFELLIKECNLNYTKKLINESLLIIVEDFNEEEIEVFFMYFSKLYIENKSDKFSNLLYVLLNNLAFSHKIFNLSSNFIEQLNLLSGSLKNDNYKNNNTLLISILLIDLIKNKELDLSNSSFDCLIEETINELDRKNPNNLELFKLLNRFNYPFDNHDFLLDINSQYDYIIDNISKFNNALNISKKKAIIHHYIKTSDQYFELFLFFLEKNSKELIEELLINFIKIIDELRFAFKSVIWFDEFLNFQIIKGSITEAARGGFYVKIDDGVFNKTTKEKQLEPNYNKDFVSQYGFGFLNAGSLKEYPEIRKLYNIYNRKYLSKNIYKKIDDTQFDDINSFLISKVNYSSSNKGKIITFIPYDESLKAFFSKFDLKLFFPSLERLLIEKSFEYLKTESPFQKSKTLLQKIPSYNIIDDYNLNLPKEAFWRVLKTVRPSLYETIYVEHKKNKLVFNKLVKAFENGDVINGYVKSRTKGGFLVDILGQEAFLPGSQIELKPVTDYDYYIGKTMEFQVVKVYHDFKNVAVSHKILLEKEYEKSKKLFYKKLEKGIVVEGFVKNITKYGVFIDLGGIDGLIHITDLSWSRINHPNKIVVLGQKLNVVVLNFDENKSRIQLGLKQLNNHPWNYLGEEFIVGKKVKGKVVDVFDYGAFIEIIEGVEGLIHVSEMSWSKYMNNAQEFVTIGDEVEAVILSLNRDSHKMSLGIKQLITDPWVDIIKKYPIGSSFKRIVCDITNFGVFVEMEKGIDGLIYIGDLSWTMKMKHPSEFTTIGEELEVVVLELDIESRKLSLGHKQTTINPYEKFKTVFAEGTKHTTSITNVVNKAIQKKEIKKDLIKKVEIGDKVKGKIVEIEDFGALIVGIEKIEGIQGLIYTKEMSWSKYLRNAQDFVTLNEEIEAIVVGIDDKHKIFLSIKQLTPDPWFDIGGKYFVGSNQLGIVCQIVNFGVFLELEEGVEGFISISNLSWKGNIKHPSDIVKIGDKIEAKVLEIDIKEREITLSHKNIYS